MRRKKVIDNVMLEKHAYKKQTLAPREIVCRILIVCEGSKTEPNYFKAFNKKRRGIYVVEIEFGDGGTNTIQVVEEAIKKKKKAEAEGNPYDRVWAVFDKDSFPDDRFNAAILKARDNGVGCAWSNQAFELWYLLHFQYRNTSMSRMEYEKAISKAVSDSTLYKKQKNGKKYKYQKNDPDNYEIMTNYGCLESAIRSAKTLEELYSDERFASHNPCTMVHKMIPQLMGEDEALNKEIKKSVNK